MSQNMRPSQSLATVRSDRYDAELGAAERRGDRVAAKGHSIGRGHVLFVTGRHLVGDEGDVDIGLSDKEGLHKVVRHSLDWGGPGPGARTLAPVVSLVR